MSIASEITRLQGAKADLKTVITNKGVTVPNETRIDGYASLVAAIDTCVDTVTDLSMKDSSGAALVTRCTANCYVVSSGGNYKFPLVYGNGIKNGSINSAAYTRRGSTYTADFVNHLGNTITTPYIEGNTGCTASAAGLLWQTTNLIGNIELISGDECRYLKFSISNIPATNALAVLYIKDSNDDIIWSWTI